MQNRPAIENLRKYRVEKEREDEDVWRERDSTVWVAFIPQNVGQGQVIRMRLAFAEYLDDIISYALYSQDLRGRRNGRRRGGG